MLRNALFMACAGLLFCASSAFAADLSPIGRWKTIDDVTGKAKSIVEIQRDGDKISATIREYFGDRAASHPNCPNGKANKPLVGLEVVWGMSNHGDEWKGGSILDPGNGKVYGCIMRVIDGGNKLNVRGFIGISLLGRTQTWLKAD